jgi:hypothetical protein
MTFSRYVRRSFGVIATATADETERGSPMEGIRFNFIQCSVYLILGFLQGLAPFFADFDDLGEWAAFAWISQRRELQALLSLAIALVPRSWLPSFVLEQN